MIINTKSTADTMVAMAKCMNFGDFHIYNALRSIATDKRVVKFTKKRTQYGYEMTIIHGRKQIWKLSLATLSHVRAESFMNQSGFIGETSKVIEAYKTMWDSIKEMEEYDFEIEFRPSTFNCEVKITAGV